MAVLGSAGSLLPADAGVLALPQAPHGRRRHRSGHALYHAHLAGAAAFQLPLTFWILAFSMFLFLSLALVKRYAELREARLRAVTGKTGVVVTTRAIWT